MTFKKFTNVRDKSIVFNTAFSFSVQPLKGFKAPINFTSKSLQKRTINWFLYQSLV